ncbi:hypothetical protein Tco_0122228 [Tanacetum coccineum]
MIESIFYDKEIEQQMNAKKLQKQGEVDMDNALDASPVFTENSRIDSREKHESCRSGNDNNSRNKKNSSGIDYNSPRNESSDYGKESNSSGKPMTEVPYIAKYNVFAVETQHTDQPENMNDTSLIEKADSNTTPDSSNMCNNEFKDDQNANDHEYEHVVLANLIANLKLDTDENKKIQKQLRKANATLTHELNECKYALNSQMTFEIDAEVHFMTKILSFRGSKSIKYVNLKKKRSDVNTKKLLVY